MIRMREPRPLAPAHANGRPKQKTRSALSAVATGPIGAWAPPADFSAHFAFSPAVLSGKVLGTGKN